VLNYLWSSGSSPNSSPFGPGSCGLPCGSLHLLITKILIFQVDLRQNLVEAQLVGQALGTIGEQCGRPQGTTMVKAEAGQNVQRHAKEIKDA